MVAVDAVISEVLSCNNSCNNASMRYFFKGEKPANLPAQARKKYEAFGEWKVAKFVKDDAVHPGQMLRDAALPSATGLSLEDPVL